MRIRINERKFMELEHPEYPSTGKLKRIISESSAIGEYEDSFAYPGPSFLWIGEYHHLNREAVKELIIYLQHWIDHKRLAIICSNCGMGIVQNCGHCSSARC